MSHSRSIFRFIATLVAVCVVGNLAFAAEPIPGRPDRYVSDRAGIISTTTANQLNHELADFERETSNQLLVAIFPKVPEGYERDEFTVKVAHAWAVGQHGRNNGAILFVFVDDHYVRIEVGYGLEPVLTDATCATIIRNDIVPAFRRQNYGAGLNAAVRDMMLACRGEFHGTGKTIGENQKQSLTWLPGLLFFLGVFLFFGFAARRQRRYGSRYGRYDSSGSGPWFVGGGGFGSGGSGGSSGSNDSFSSGGGDFGGGGAGGNW